MKFTENHTAALLSVVGSPFEARRDVEVEDDLISLYRYAAKNRMALLFLDALEERGINIFEEDCQKLGTKHSHAMDLVIRVSDLLEEAGVDYALFKTLRPYREATVDIDILTLGSSYDNALRALSEAGYYPLEQGPLSTTFRDPLSGLGVDIHDEIGVSHLVYLDKDKLGKHVEWREVSRGRFVKALSRPADLLAVISHSVLKEQMYVLSEYYSTLFHLHNDSSGRLASSLRSLAEGCNLGLVLKIHLGITASLHRYIHGFVPRVITDICDELETGMREYSRARKLSTSFPLKYHPMTIAEALADLLKESKGRHSIALQVLKMFDPHLSLRVARKIFLHTTRETY